MTRRHLAAAALVASCALPTVRAEAALGGRKAGWFVDVGAGLGVGDLPFTTSPGWTVAAGGWFGKYDDDFALGRHWGFGVRLRQDLQLAQGRRMLRSAPMVEVRRGVDLLVVGLHAAVLAGPLLETPLDITGSRLVGATVRVAGGVKYRFSPVAGVGLRLETGIDIDGPRVEPVLALTAGFEFSAPVPRH